MVGASSPDAIASGLVSGEVDPMRYAGTVHHPREATGILNAYMPDHARVLDVGCGDGLVTKAANLHRDNEIVGIELDEDRAALARANGIDVRTEVLDETLQRELGLFDVVMLADVLEHVAAPDQFLSLLKASLVPGGLLLLSVPNVAHYSVRWSLLWGRFDYRTTGIMDATHLRWFTAASLRRLLAASGFEVLTMKHSVGSWVADNVEGPLRFLPSPVRNRALSVAAMLMPRLFGVQHVVKARLPVGHR